jgi:hypothetical protein
MKAAIALLPLLLLSPLPASADPPEVDVAALCRDLAWTGIRASPTILDECRRWEGEARAAVAPLWDGLPAATRIHCGRLALANGTGSNKALAMCVRAAVT